MTDAPTLKPCPFCGAPATVWNAFPSFEDGWIVSIEHGDKCPIRLSTSGMICHDTAEKAANEWNARNGAQSDANRVNLLEDAVVAVVEATRAYLPPDGIDAQECLNRILEATDNPTINPIIFEIEIRAALEARGLEIREKNDD